MSEYLNKVTQGDSIEVMRKLADKSVDMILCDLPYGTTACKWDVLIPFEQLWAEYERVIKDNGAIVLTAGQPFTSVLITSNLRLYKYNWIWEKSKVGGVFNAKNRPLKTYEDVCVFSKAPAANVKGTKLTYNPQGLSEVEFVRSNSARSGEETIGNRPSRVGEYKQTQTGYPKDVLRIRSESKTVHPTQKPVALFEYLIKTYSNEGDVILDNCIGSGTTAVAAIKTGRQFIGIERETEYCEIARKRIDVAFKEVTTC